MLLRLLVFYSYILDVPPWLVSTCEMTLLEPFLGCSNKTGLPERTKLMRQMVGRLVTCRGRGRNWRRKGKGVKRKTNHWHVYEEAPAPFCTLLWGRSREGHLLKYSIHLVHTPPLIMFTRGKSTYVRTWGSKNGEGVCSNQYISGIYGTNIHDTLCMGVHMTRSCHLNSCCVLLFFFHVHAFTCRTTGHAHI